MSFFLLFGIVFVLLLGGVIFYIWGTKERRKKFFEDLDLVLFLIRFPHASAEGKDMKQEINRSEQLFASLLSFKKPFIFEIAVPHIGEEIHFYAAVPSVFQDPFMREVQALWPDAQVERADDFNVFQYAGISTGAFVKQKDHFMFPVRTYEEVNADTFLPIVGGLAKLNEVGEGAAMQVIVKSASSHYKKEIQKALRDLKAGKATPSKDISTKVLRGVGEIFFSSGDKKENLEEKTVDALAVQALEAKLSKPLFEVNVRIIASAPSQYQADAIMEGIAGPFSQFGAPERNELKIVRPKNLQNLMYQFSFREFSDEGRMVLTSAELASLFHFPTPFMEIPRMKFVKTKEAPSPTNLPTEGTLIGESTYRGERRPVMITDEDRRRHVYLIGQTGTGKSNLLVNMAVSDIGRGKGVAIMDPHGDFTEDILGLIPPEREKDVILFDPSDFSHPLGLNMIEYDPTRPEEKTFIVNEMQSIFNKLFLAETMGPMFEQYMRNALLLLMEDAQNEPATLMEVSRVFTDPAFRARKLARIHNPAVMDFWEKEAAKAGGEASLANMTPYITSKFNNFTANDYMRVIIGQTKSAFHFRDIMDQGKILLINLAKGKIGDINANLLGMIIVGKFLMAALSRTDVSDREQRRDFNLYIDEFQNFTTDSISIILSEARKYRLNLTIAHQFIAQLTDKVRDAVFGNVGNIVSFRVGAQDAEVLVKQFVPTFTQQDLLNIDNFHAYAKLLIRGETAPPFTIQTLRAHPGDHVRAAVLKERSQKAFARNREDIEAEIYKRLRE